MKKIILSLTTLAFVAIVVTGVTYATWSADHTVQGNTISAGSVELSVVEGQSTQATIKPLLGDNMFPGDWTEMFQIALKNDSTAPGKLYMHTTNFQGSGGICANTNLRVEVHGDDPGHAPEQWLAYEGPVMDLEGEANRLELTGPMLEMIAHKIESEDSVFDPYLPETWVLVTHQKAQLDEEAPNSAQNQTCTWDEVFVLEPYFEEAE